MYVNGVLSVIGRKWSGCRWPRGQRVATRGLGVHGFCRSPWPASCYPWLGFSRFWQGLVSGKWQNNWVVMVFTGSCQWQGAKTHGFHGICRVLSMVSDQNPRFSRYLLGLVSGQWPKPRDFIVFAGSSQWQATKHHGLHGCCRVSSAAR